MFGLVNLTGLKIRYYGCITQCYNRRIKAQCNPINNGLVLLCESNGSYKSIKVANNFLQIRDLQRFELSKSKLSHA